LRVIGGRVRAVIVAVLATILIASIQVPPATEAHAPGIDPFLYALGQVESGGNYTARNSTSGAYGKYQIMPANWGPWALRYLGDASAPQTPANQEAVARGKVHDLYHWLGSWKRVAYWWLTGSTKTSGWTTYATSFVNKVMAIYNQSGDTGTGDTGDTAGSGSASTWTLRRYAETSSRIVYRGTWIRAGHRSYTGGSVRQAKYSGQTATFTFSGQQVVWVGPKGPTRGQARVWIDGERITTVDLYASRFVPRTRLFTHRFGGSGAHTLVIEVLGTRGRPVVAIDEFVVWN